MSFVLPAFNEAANIARAVESVLAVAAGHCSAFEVIVVDDGSVDDTAAIVDRLAARRPEIRLLRHGRNCGYGDALQSGFGASRYDYVFLTDADNQFDIREFPDLLGWSGRADVVAGYRRRRRDPLMRLVNARVWNLLVRSLFCVPLRDIDCAFKLFRRSALASVDLQSHGAMVSTEIVVKLARRGATFVEVPVTHLPRVAGAPKGARASTIVRALRELAEVYPVLRGLEPARPAACEVAVAPAGAGPALPLAVGAETLVALPDLERGAGADPAPASVVELNVVDLQLTTETRGGR